jgi:hypothetical protein
MPTKISQLAEYNLLTASAFIPIVDNNETVGDKNKKISITDLRKVFYLNSRNTSSFIRHTPGLYYFGDNSDGPGNFSGSITTLRTRISASFASTQDGAPVIKNFSSLFISRSVVISPTNRCRGMLIFVDGDATISGSLRMTARGASAVGADASFTTINPPYLGDYWSTQLFPSASYLSRVFAAGAAGGPTSPAAGAGPVGSVGTNGRSGGGGAGGGSGPASGGAGSSGTSYSGGSGGGGGGGGGAGTAASANGGAGGNGNTFGAGGAGNPGGTSPSGNAGGNGTGGLLILIVRGNLKIGPNGSINANGSNGGNFSSSPSQSGGGGGSGGGIIYIYYGGRLTNNGTVTANGGSGGIAGPTNSFAGGAGGAGTSVLLKLNTAFPAAN